MRHENPEKFKAQGRRKYDILRKQILDHYGRTCACCGETEEDFLTIDHIHGGGNQHKITGRMGRGGGRLYAWLISHNFPEGFQILCMNCNFSKGKLRNQGLCAHKKTKAI